MVLKDVKNLRRSEILNLPIIELALRGDPQAIAYLENWSDAPLIEINNPSKASLKELLAWDVEEYNRMALELRKRRGEA